jgi:tetratricopeptide (TPR) repeat protein
MIDSHHQHHHHVYHQSTDGSMYMECRHCNLLSNQSKNNYNLNNNSFLNQFNNNISNNNQQSNQNNINLINLKKNSIKLNLLLEQSMFIDNLMKLFKDLAHAFYNLKQFECEKALQYFEQLPPNQIKSCFVLNNMAKAHFELHNYLKAEKIYLELRREYPYHLEGLEFYSTTLWHLQKEIALSSLAQELTEYDKLAPETWCVVGNCFSLHKEHDAAIKFFQRATQVDPNFVYAYNLLGHEYFLIEEMDKGLSCFRKAIFLDPRHYNAWYGISMIHLKQEKFILAEKYLKKALLINPHSSTLMCHIAVVYHSLKQSEKALQILDRALVIEPKNTLCKFHRASILFSMEKYDDALEDFEKLRRIIPKESLIYYMISKTHKKLKNVHLSLMYMSWAMDLDPKGVNNQLKESIDKRYVVDSDSTFARELETINTSTLDAIYGANTTNNNGNSMIMQNNENDDNDDNNNDLETSNNNNNNDSSSISNNTNLNNNNNIDNNITIGAGTSVAIDQDDDDEEIIRQDDSSLLIREGLVNSGDLASMSNINNQYLSTDGQLISEDQDEEDEDEEEAAEIDENNDNDNSNFLMNNVRDDAEIFDSREEDDDDNEVEEDLDFEDSNTRNQMIEVDIKSKEDDEDEDENIEEDENDDESSDLSRKKDRDNSDDNDDASGSNANPSSSNQLDNNSKTNFSKGGTNDQNNETYKKSSRGSNQDEAIYYSEETDDDDDDDDDDDPKTVISNAKSISISSKKVESFENRKNKYKLGTNRFKSRIIPDTSISNPSDPINNNLAKKPTSINIKATKYLDSKRFITTSSIAKTTSIAASNASINSKKSSATTLNNNPMIKSMISKKTGPSTSKSSTNAVKNSTIKPTKTTTALPSTSKQVIKKNITKKLLFPAASGIHKKTNYVISNKKIIKDSELKPTPITIVNNDLTFDSNTRMIYNFKSFEHIKKKLDLDPDSNHDLEGDESNDQPIEDYMNRDDSENDADEKLDNDDNVNYIKSNLNKKVINDINKKHLSKIQLISDDLSDSSGIGTLTITSNSELRNLNNMSNNSEEILYDKKNNLAENSIHSTEDLEDLNALSGINKSISFMSMSNMIDTTKLTNNETIPFMNQSQISIISHHYNNKLTLTNSIQKSNHSVLSTQDQLMDSADEDL